MSVFNFQFVGIRLSDLVNLVDSGLSQEESCRSPRERQEFGENLTEAITNFTLDFIPHMDEEEEVRGWVQKRSKLGSKVKKKGPQRRRLSIFSIIFYFK